MKFGEFTFQRPDLETLEKEFNRLLVKLRRANSCQEQEKVIIYLNDLRTDFESMELIAKIRHTIDTTDPQYKEEQDNFDHIKPVYQGFVTRYYQELVNSSRRDELEKKLGKQLFVKGELALKTFSPEIIEELQQENQLTSTYTNLLASAKIYFAGEERNLAQLAPFQLSRDRIIRRQANEAKYSFFQEHEQELDDIYDRLVSVRTKIALKLGYRDFVALGYDRLYRSDYNPALVAGFREQVLKYVVPVASKLKESQAKRIGVDGLKYYDDKFIFPAGNPVPRGGPEQIIGSARRMYRELAPETGAFFDLMLDKSLLDLVSKKGKAGGGYCAFISKWGAPFIFANFNGTSGDIDVLTHEAGHAFQVYSSRNFQLPEYHWPTLEAAEIHSMSMEFFAWPWLELFFEEDAEKYKFMQLSEALVFIPYGVAVDEFQHLVYGRPEMTSGERKQAWREQERKYLPYRDYEDNAYLERGGFWHQQGHIFKNPFYYIDYTLAQVCAFQFWIMSRENREAAWSNYLKLCRAGGSKSFTDLVQEADLISPFAPGCVEQVVAGVTSGLEAIDA